MRLPPLIRIKMLQEIMAEKNIRRNCYFAYLCIVRRIDKNRGITKMFLFWLEDFFDYARLLERNNMIMIYSKLSS